MPADTVKRRLLCVLGSAALFCVLGVVYAVFVRCTGIGLVCPLYFLTGLKCPGCGVTHMCLALLRLDFPAAFAANPVLLLLSPVLAAIFVTYSATYIRTGHRQMYRWQNVVLWSCITILVLYGIIRNVPLPF